MSEKDENIIPLSNTDVAASETMDIITRYVDKLDQEQVEAIPLLGSGMSITKVADYLGVKRERIDKWLKTDAVFIQAVKEFKFYREQFHKNMLDQAGAMAWSRILEYLSKDVGPLDSEMLKIQASTAKFIISELGLKTQKSEIVHDIKPQLHVTEDSAEIIARKLKELDSGQDIIESEYRIALENIPHEQDKFSGMDVAQNLATFNGEDFNEEINEIQSKNSSNYVMYPECSYGVLDYDQSAKKFRCHVCGKWTKDLVVHIRSVHKLSPGRYRNMYGLHKDVKFYIEVPSSESDSESTDVE